VFVTRLRNLGALSASCGHRFKPLTARGAENAEATRRLKPSDSPRHVLA